MNRMEPNTDRMSFAIIALLIAGAVAAALLTPGLPKLVGLYTGAGNINFLQWLFSIIGEQFNEFINQAGNGTFSTIILPKLY